MLSSIISIATKSADHVVLADDMLQYMLRSFKDEQAHRKIKFLFREASIKQKSSVLSDFTRKDNQYSLFHPDAEEAGTSERLSVFKKNALSLSLQVSREALDKAAKNQNQITDIITVSCTGMYAPGLETELAVALQLPTQTKRHAVNFMGCYAAFHALRLADMICKTDGKALVLIVCLELCTLHFRKDASDDNLLATYLFGDGVAACLVSNERPSNKQSALEQHGFHSVLLPEGAEDMGWQIGAFGFEMILKRNIPKHLEKNIKNAYLQTINLSKIKDLEIDHFAIHPGGKNILRAFEKALSINSEKLSNSYDVLANHGNMSSATVLFVLEKYLYSSNQGWLYSAAFGPGLSVESGLFKLVK